MTRVFVVDDEPVIRFVICEALRDAGFEPLGTDSAREALAWLTAGKSADAIVVDLLMRGMTGRDFLAALRANPVWAGIPAVLVTGAVFDAATFPAEGSYQAIVQKPFSLQDVVAAVERALQEAGTDTAGGQL